MSKVIIDIPFLEDDYIFMPAGCYNGNRFRVLKKKYAPMFRIEEAGPDVVTTITDVPRLNPDGSGKIELTSGDLSVPCIGVYSPARGKGWLLFTVQEIEGKNVGLAYAAGQMILTWPARREEVYRGFKMNPNDEVWEDGNAEIPHRLLTFDCVSLEQFYAVFFENRKIMGLDAAMPEPCMSREEQLKLQIDKFNRYNWRERGEFYAVGCDDNQYQVWQPGWTGGAMPTYTFLKMGGTLEKERSVKTLAHLFRYQGASGLFWAGCDKDLVRYADGFGTPGTERWTLIRKSADCLYFVLRQFELLDTVPAEFEAGIQKTADAFVRLWEKYGQLGQFIDVETGEIGAGGSTSGGIAPAGLVLASRYFKEPKYLRAAGEIGDYYYDNFVAKGYTTGGPGEILQCPDSESAAGLLESYVWLYEETKDPKHLAHAVTTAHLCSSWVVAYNYRFPETSEFGKLGMKTVGTVIANVQNKHSAPGICTLSGTSLKKLYEWTGDEKFLDLYREIAAAIPQYISREDRPIHSPDGRAMPAGFINERVNLSDWEGYDHVGEIFWGSCWCEVSALLTLAEM